MALKKIQYNVRLLSTEKTPQGKTPVVYTNDLNSVEFVFNILDMTPGQLAGATATTLLYMRDGSFFQNSDVDFDGTTFTYLLKENEGNHGGLAKIQLVVKIGTAEYASQFYNFEVVSGLETKVAVPEVMIHDWTTLTREARAYIDQFVADEAVRQQQFETAEANRATFFETAETNRTTAETNRVSAEQARVSAEAGRVDAETSRASAESVRVSAEQTRVSAENARKGFYERFESELSKKANKQQEEWITPTLINGWTTGDNALFDPIQYKKDNFGCVHLRGGIANGVNRNICALPVGYRPKGAVPIVAKKQWSHTQFDWVTLHANGILTISNTFMPADTRLYFYAIFLAEN